VFDGVSACADVAGFDVVFREEEMIDCWLAAADMKRRLGRLKEAEAEIDKCIAAAARHPTKLGYALYQKGYIFFLRNDFDVAEKLFRESASSEEKCPRAGWEVTSRISAAQAEVARLRRLTGNDQYSRQVAHRLTVVSSTHPEDLADLEASLMQHLDFFRTRTESHAKRWVSNCVVHLADVRFEMGHSEKAKKDLTNHQESDEGKNTFLYGLKYSGCREGFCWQKKSPSLQKSASCVPKAPIAYWGDGKNLPVFCWRWGTYGWHKATSLLPKPCTRK